MNLYFIVGFLHLKNITITIMYMVQLNINVQLNIETRALGLVALLKHLSFPINTEQTTPGPSQNTDYITKKVQSYRLP